MHDKIDETSVLGGIQTPDHYILNPKSYPLGYYDPDSNLNVFDKSFELWSTLMLIKKF